MVGAPKGIRVEQRALPFGKDSAQIIERTQNEDAVQRADVRGPRAAERPAPSVTQRSIPAPALPAPKITVSSVASS